MATIGGGPGGRVRVTSLTRMRTVYLGTSPFAVAVLERLADERPPAAARRHPPGPPARARRKLAGAAGGRRRPGARHRGDPARQRELRRRPRGDRRRATRRRRDLRVRRAASASRSSSEHPMWNVHPSLLPRWRGAAPIERAIDAGDSETGVSIMRPTAEMDAGPVCLQSRASRSAPTTTTARSRRGWSGWAASCSCGRSTTARRSRSSRREGVTLADKIGAEDRRLDPALGAAHARAPGAGADAAHRRFRGDPDGERLGVRRAAVAGGRSRARESWPRATGGSSTAPPTARSSCSRSPRPGRARWTPRPTCAAAAPGSCGDHRGKRRAAVAHTRCSAASSTRAPSPTAPSAPRPSAPGSTRATARFAQQLAYGAVQRRATLDHLIRKLSSRPPAKLDPPRARRAAPGLLQLLFLDGVADHAAVSESVELAKAAAGARRGRNAVLRRAQREGRRCSTRSTTRRPTAPR